MSVSNRIAYGVLWLAISLALLAPPAYADGTIDAVFRIESEFFVRAFPEDVRSQTETQIAAELANLAKSHFGFLDWHGPAVNERPRLVLSLVDIAGGACELPPTMRLRWSARLNGRERALASVAQHDLYQTCDPNIPAQEPPRLVADVVAAAQVMLDNEATRRAIARQVLARVPIASQLVPHQNEMLLLPVAPSRLLADPESEMVAKFKFARLDAQAVPSDIKLRPNSEHGDNVQLLIIAINVPSVPADVSSQGTVWHDALIDILQDPIDLRVFMIDYVPSPFAGETLSDTGVVSDL